MYDKGPTAQIDRRTEGMIERDRDKEIEREMSLVPINPFVQPYTVPDARFLNKIYDTTAFDSRYRTAQYSNPPVQRGTRKGRRKQ